MKYCLGINDEEFVRGNIPMTKKEIRILTLVQAKITADSVIVDIGAGTGSLSIEAALLAKNGHVYAVERETEGIELIKQNMARFGVDNITPICQAAPAALSGLPSADAVLIGGSGGNLQDIVIQADKLLLPQGRIVLTAVTVDTLHNGLKYLEELGYAVEACGVQINRIRSVGSVNMFQALNQVYIIKATKGG